MRKLMFTAAGVLFAFLNMPAFGGELSDGLRAVKSGQYADALSILVPLANSGDDEAQRVVGEMCFKGQGMKRDVFAAFKWTEISAAGRNKIAQYNLGYLYEKGEGVAASRALAIEWYTKAAVQGYVAAQGKLGDIYQASEIDQSIYWYGKASENGDDVARSNFSRLSAQRNIEIEQQRMRDWEKQRPEREAAAAQKRMEVQALQQEAQIARDERARRDAHDWQSQREANASLGAYIAQKGAENARILQRVDRQTNAAINESNRVLAAQAAERDRARAERQEQDASRARAQRERLADDQRSAQLAEQRRASEAAAARERAERQTAEQEQKAQAERRNAQLQVANSGAERVANASTQHSSSEKRYLFTLERTFTGNGNTEDEARQSAEKDFAFRGGPTLAADRQTVLAKVGPNCVKNKSAYQTPFTCKITASMEIDSPYDPNKKNRSTTGTVK